MPATTALDRPASVADAGSEALGPPHPRGLADEAARVRVGASPHTEPDVLRSLANDPSVTVRAAVAINPATPAHVDTMLVDDIDERVRTLLARKLASLIPSLPVGQRDQIRNHAFVTLSRLVEDEAERVRAAIAAVVKDMPGAPRELILRLARDSAVSVYDPVIRLSPLLTAEDLLALLAARPAPGTATAVASRPGLSESVADAIAASADTDAVTALLQNRSAAIREATLDALIAGAAEITPWHAPLVHRPRLNARAARALSEIVTTRLLDELASRADLEPATSAELRRRLATRQQVQPDRPEADMEQAIADARVLSADGKLDEDALLAAIQRGEARFATAIIAVAASLPASVVDRAATLRSAKGLVSLVWKAGFSMRVAEPLQTLLARLAPEAALRAAPSGSFPLAIEEMRWQINFLSRMGR